MISKYYTQKKNKCSRLLEVLFFTFMLFQLNIKIFAIDINSQGSFPIAFNWESLFQQFQFNSIGYPFLQGLHSERIFHKFMNFIQKRKLTIAVNNFRLIVATTFL